MDALIFSLDVVVFDVAGGGGRVAFVGRAASVARRRCGYNPFAQRIA